MEETLSLKDIKINSPSTEKRKLEIIEKKYEDTWRCCSGGNVDRRAIKYFSQLFIGCSVILFCMSELMNTRTSCESSNVYIGLLSTIIGIFLPQPNLS